PMPSFPANTTIRAVGALLVGLSVSACLFDSSYWQQKAAQRSVATQRTPRTLQATPNETPDLTASDRLRGKPLRVRAYATTSYAAEVVDWPRQLGHLVDDANRILAPTLNARLEVVDTRAWSTQLSSDSLDALLTALREIDAGDDVDLVVGLVG